MILSHNQFMELRSKPNLVFTDAQTSSASLTEISPKSHKEVLEIKICLCCFSGSSHCCQMLWGLNSYLKSKDIFLMTAELRPLGIEGNLLNQKARDSREKAMHIHRLKSCFNSGIPQLEAEGTFQWRRWQVTKKNKCSEIPNFIPCMVISSHKTYVHSPSFNPSSPKKQQHNAQLQNAKQVFLLAAQLYTLRLPTPSFSQHRCSELLCICSFGFHFLISNLLSSSHSIHHSPLAGDRSLESQVYILSMYRF